MADDAVPGTRRFRIGWPDSEGWITGALFAGFLLAPPVLAAIGEPFLVQVVHRAMILAIAAVGLNLLLGFGGLVSFGHAAFIGLGAYAVGIPAYYGYDNGFLHLGLAIAVCGFFALVTGAISLRTRAVHFIMITMAFGQMAYYAFVSLDEYGGDDGLVILSGSSFPAPLDIGDDGTLYYVTLAVLAGCVYLVRAITRSRFGLVIQAARGSERRARTAGFNPQRYFLVLYVISGVICGLAGVLLANFTDFITPEMMGWTRSGELMFMVILGGIATRSGPIIGALAFLLIEELLSGFTLYWQFFFGVLLILVVLMFRNGLRSLLPGDRR